MTGCVGRGSSSLPAYGEVVGSYGERSGRAFLKVDRIDHLTPGKDCHLAAAIGRAFPGGKEAVPDAEPSRAQLADIMTRGGQKFRDGDYRGAVALMKPLDDLIEPDRGLIDFRDLIDIAMIETAYGDALKLGRLGDACQRYAVAGAHALKARSLAASDTDADRRDIARHVSARIDIHALRAACVAPVAGAPDPAFVGHYYLSAVRETGSELMLDAKGAFQWSMSYGAVDQTAKGTWHRDGGTIVLNTALPPSDRPLFAYLNTAPWTAEAEQHSIRRRYEAMAETVRTACPFRTDGWVSTLPVVAIDRETPKPSPEVLRRQADNTRAAAILARTRVETLARQIMARPPSQRAEAEVTEQAHSALSDWLAARDKAQEAASAAGLADPGLGEPALPAACIVPAAAQAGDDPRSWAGGLGVRVYDPASGQGAHDVRVTLRFTDGHLETLVTAEDGTAILPPGFAKGAIAATLHAAYAPGRDARLTFAPVMSGMLQFSIDASQLAEPPFATLTLTISGKSLLAEDFGSGRYVRQS